VDGFTYAHDATASGGRKSRTQNLNGGLPFLKELIADARSREIPVSCEESLQFLRTFALAVKAENILELGTAIGLSGIALLSAGSLSHLTTIEKSQEFFNEAKKNFSDFSLSDRVTQIFGDAAEIIGTLPENSYDLIFLDCAKAQYIKFLPKLKKLLKIGGTLIADDILLFGWITGETPVPQKRRMLFKHMREYVDAALEDGDLSTVILDIGDGISISVRRN